MQLLKDKKLKDKMMNTLFSTLEENRQLTSIIYHEVVTTQNVDRRQYQSSYGYRICTLIFLACSKHNNALIFLLCLE